MADTLKPCPFCGADARLEQDEDHHGKYYSLGCLSSKCPAYWFIYTAQPEDTPVSEAIKQWNTRKGA